MANNTAKYGFRYYTNIRGGGMPPALEAVVASGYNGDFSGAVGISIGDPVELVTDGSVILANDTATDPGRVYGIVASIQNAKVDFSATKSRPASFLPNSTTYTTKKNESRLGVIPVTGVIWEVDADDNVTATTEAAYRALIGLNFPISATRDTSNPDKPRYNPRIDISVSGTGTDHLRLVGISKTALNTDFSGTGVKLLVMFNEGFDPALTTTGL